MAKYTIKKLPNFKLFPGYQAVVQITFEKGKYTRDQIYKIVSEYNKTAYEAGFRGKLMTSIKYPDKTYSGKATYVGDSIDLFSLSEYEAKLNKRLDPDYYEQFYVYVAKVI